MTASTCSTHCLHQPNLNLNQSRDKSPSIVKTIVTIALGALAFFSAALFDCKNPKLATILRFTGVGLGLIGIFKRCYTSISRASLSPAKPRREELNPPPLVVPAIFSSPQQTSTIHFNSSQAQTTHSNPHSILPAINVPASQPLSTSDQKLYPASFDRLQQQTLMQPNILKKDKVVNPLLNTVQTPAQRFTSTGNIQELKQTSLNRPLQNKHFNKKSVSRIRSLSPSPNKAQTTYSSSLLIKPTDFRKGEEVKPLLPNTVHVPTQQLMPLNSQELHKVPLNRLEQEDHVDPQQGGEPLMFQAALKRDEIN